MSLDGQGNLDLQTAGGRVVQQAPVIYQTVSGVRQAVTGSQVLLGGGMVGFQVGSYDTTQPLVIDPVLGYSSYLGGSGNDYGYGIAVDGAGDAYLTGSTASTNFPTTTGPQLAGSSDAFVTKLNPQGNGLVYSTLIGGSGADQGNGIAVDLAGNAFVVGTTSSSNFPTTSGAYQGSLTGTSAAFVTALNATGDDLTYSTYLGPTSPGPFADGNAIAVSPRDIVAVTGATSGSFPTTPGAYQTTYGGATEEAFVAWVNPQGYGTSSLLYSTYLGGDGSDAGQGIAMDFAGANAYVTGSTAPSLMTPFPTTFGAYQAGYGGGSHDAFVTAFPGSSGGAPLFSTLLGGTGDDQGFAVAVDRSQNVYVTGSTTGSFPTTPGAAQAAYGGGTTNAFVTELNNTLGSLTYSTYLGGGGTDAGYGIAVNTAGEAFVTGVTSSSNFPTAGGAFQTTSGGGNDAFVTRVSSTGTTFVYSSYLGGSGDDQGKGIALDPVNNAYVAGYTNSTNFPTASPYQGSNAGGYDAFVADVLPKPPPPVFTGISPDTGSSSSDQITNSQNLTINGTAAPNSTVTLTRRGVGVLGTATANSSGVWSYNYSGTTLPEGTYAFTATDTLGGLTSDPAADYLVTVDLTAPTVALTAPASTTSVRPQVRVAASDLNGLPNGTTVTLQVYNSSGTTLLYTATGSLTDGTTTMLVPTLTVGTAYLLKAQVTDLAGNTGTSTGQPLSVTTVSSPWVPTGQVLTADPLTGQSFEQLGNVQVTHDLDLDQSPGTGQSGNAQMVYNGDSVHVQPAVQATLTTNNNAALPGTLTGTLIWDKGGTPTTTTLSYSTSGANPGDVLTLAAQVSAAVTTTKRYAWELDLSTPAGTETATGVAYVVTQDASPFGSGWTFSPLDQLVSIPADSYGPAGMLRVYGSGGWRFYQGTTSFTSPAGDNGTLTLSSGTYTYSTPDGQVTTFNSSGQETSWASADGQQTLQFRYSGSNLTGMTAIDGGVSTFSYSGGLLATVQTVNGRTTSFAYSGTNLTQVTNPDGGLHTFAYDGNHRLTGETFANLQNEWAYNSAGTLGTFTWGSPTGGGQTNLSNTVLSPAVVQGLAVGGSGTAAVGNAQASSTDPDGHVTLWQLDGQGRPLQQVAADGGRTQWAYSNGYVSSQTDPLGRTTTFARDGAGYVTQQTNPDGSLVTYQYQSAFHALTTLTNERGYSTTYAYDSQGHQTSMTDALGETTSYAYNTAGLLTKVTDALGHSTSYGYDAYRRQTTVTDALGDVTTTTFDANGNPQTTTDARGNVTTTSYDVMGHLTATTDALGNTTTTTYNAAGLQLTSTDPLGHQGSTVYDTFNRGLLAEALSAVGTGSQQDSLSSFDKAGQQTQGRNPDGWSSSTTYDPMGRPAQLTNAQNGQTKTWYDLAGQVLATRDELGRWTQHAYNSRGWETATTDPLGDVTTMAYDLAGNKTAVTDPLGHTTTTAYDKLNRETVVTDALGFSATTTYDAAGNKSTVTDQLGHVTSYGYDAANRLTMTTEAVGTSVQRSETTGYDAVGNKTTETDALGRTTTYAYDKANQQTAVTDALGRTTTTAYDQAGNQVAMTDPLSHTTTSGYDALNRQVTTTDPLSETTTSILDAVGAEVGTLDPLKNLNQSVQDSLGQEIRPLDAKGGVAQQFHDAAGNLVLSIDANGNRTAYVYDGLNRLVQTTDALGDISTVVYDAAGNKVATVDPLGHRTTVAYDALNRPTQTTDALGDVTTTVYDGAGNRVASVDARGNRTTVAYDALNRPTQTTDALGDLSTVVYDAVGNQVATVDPLGHRTTTAYDALNRPTQTTDALGDLTTTVYDAAGNRQATVDALGRRTTFAYDSANRLTQTTDALNHLSTVVYDAAGNQIATVDPLGNRTTTAYDALNRPTQTTDALGDLTTTVYDAVGNQVATVDARGNRTTVAYDALNRPTQTTDALGDLTTTVYDAAGNRVATVDARGNRTTVAYDAVNRPTQTTDALGDISTVVYDAAGNRIATVDPLGHRTTTAYDALNRPTQTTDALGDLSTTVYDAAGNRIATVDARGNRTTVAYDALNRPTQTTDALGGLTTVVLDAVGNTVASVDPLGNRTSYSYDALNRRTTTTDPLGNITTVVLDAAGNRLSTTNPRGYTTSFAYDALNRLTQTTDALGDLSTVVYDAAGNQIATVDARGNRTTSVYDALNRVVGRTDALGHTSTTVYDAAGNAVQAIDPLGFVTTSVYDAVNRVVSVQDPGGGVNTTVYDAAGNVVNKIDPVGDKTTLAYDALNRLTQTTDPLNGTATSVYDAVGNRVNLIDPDGNKTTFAFDALNHLTKTTDPLGNAGTTAYDLAGRVTSATDRLGRRRDSSYDKDGRKTGETWVTSGVTVNTLTYTYDAAGNQLTAADGHGAYTMAYDPLDRVTVTQEPFGQTLTGSYDAVGNRTLLVDSLGGTTTSVYDAVNHLTSRQFSAAGQTPVRFDQAYTARDQVATLTRYSDLGGTQKVGETDYTYDGVGRTSNIQHKDGSGNLLANYTYTYDLASRVTAETDDGTTTSYSYDSTNQLTAAGTATYSYDANGNRTMAGYQTGADNRLTTDGTWTYTYDAEGNRVKKSKGPGLETWYFGYDSRNQMVSVEQTSNGTTVLMQTTYTYDVFGARIEEDKWKSGTGVVTTRYALDGENVWADLTGGNALQARYVRPDGVDALGARVKSDGSIAWYLVDKEGSVRALTDNGGVVQDKLTYDGFGGLVSETNATFGDRYKYTGREYDSDSKLQYNRDRWYDTLTGRWTSEDPLGLAAGDPNLVRYVRNGPTDGTDPSGEFLLATNFPAAELWMTRLTRLGMSPEAYPLNFYQKDSTKFFINFPPKYNAHSGDHLAEEYEQAYGGSPQDAERLQDAITNPSPVIIGDSSGRLENAGLTDGEFRALGDLEKNGVQPILLRSTDRLLLEHTTGVQASYVTPFSRDPVPARDLRGRPLYQTDDPLVQFGQYMDTLFAEGVDRTARGIMTVVMSPGFQQGLRFLGGVLEMAEGVLMLLTPEPSGVSKVSGLILIGHGLDTALAASETLEQGKYVPTMTQQAATRVAKLVTDDKTADAIGVFVDNGGPIAVNLANGARYLLRSATGSTASGGALRLRSVYQGGPYRTGRFGRGGRRWRGKAYRSGQVRAERIVHQAGRALGVDVRDLVDEIIYVPGAKSPFFTVQDGRRIIALNLRAVRGRDESLRLLKAAHEIGHARVYNNPALRTAISYEAEEVLVEGQARAALGGVLSPKAVRNSVQYENDYRALVGLPPLPVPP